jgi:broad specificity phosphatase PhoE
VTTEIYLARHGDSEWNAGTHSDRFNGRTDIGLTEQGYAQAENLGRALASVELNAIYSSSLERAVETARRVAEHQDLEVRREERLVEIDCGDWEGMSLGKVEAAYPDYFAKWLSDPSVFPFPNGEGIYDVAARVMPRVTEIVLKHDGGSVLIVAHKIVNSVILSHWMGVHPSDARRLVPQRTCGLNHVVLDRGEAVEVTRLDDPTHLFS